MFGPGRAGRFGGVGVLTKPADPAGGRWYAKFPSAEGVFVCVCGEVLVLLLLLGGGGDEEGGGSGSETDGRMGRGGGEGRGGGCRQTDPSHQCESPMRVTNYASHQPESLTRVSHPSLSSESLIRVCYPSLPSDFRDFLAVR